MGCKKLNAKEKRKQRRSQERDDAEDGGSAAADEPATTSTQEREQRGATQMDMEQSHLKGKAGGAVTERAAVPRSCSVTDAAKREEVASFLASCKHVLLDVAAGLDTKGKRGGKAAEKRRTEAKSRSQALSTSSDVHGVSFAGVDFQRAYFDSKFERRGLLCYSLFEAIFAGPDTPLRACCSALTEDARAAAGVTTPLQIMSYGGGPGTDASGLAFVQEHFLRRQGGRGGGGESQGMPIMTLLDYEPTWRRYEKTLSTLFAKSLRTSFRRCDVTVAVPNSNYHVGIEQAGQDIVEDAPHSDIELIDLIAETQCYDGYSINQGLGLGGESSISAVDLHLFAYVAHETSHKAAANRYVFYTDLVLLAKPGAMLVFFDVQSRAHPVYEAIVSAMTAALLRRGLLSWRRLVAARRQSAVAVVLAAAATQALLVLQTAQAAALAVAAVAASRAVALAASGVGTSLAEVEAAVSLSSVSVTNARLVLAERAAIVAADVIGAALVEAEVLAAMVQAGMALGFEEEFDMLQQAAPAKWLLDQAAAIALPLRVLAVAAEKASCALESSCSAAAAHVLATAAAAAATVPAAAMFTTKQAAELVPTDKAATLLQHQQLAAALVVQNACEGRMLTALAATEGTKAELARVGNLRLVVHPLASAVAEKLASEVLVVQLTDRPQL